MSDDNMIAALLRERDGYRSAGRPDRVAEVDEQLALRGHAVEPAPDKERPTPRVADPRSAPPKGRHAPGKVRGR